MKGLYFEDVGRLASKQYAFLIMVALSMVKQKFCM